MTQTAIILGARIGTGNIGDAVFSELDRRKGWLLDANDCQTEENWYDVPPVPWSDYDALVCALGLEGGTPFADCEEDEVTATINANLTLPLNCIRTWVQARGAQGGKCVVIGSYAHDHVLTWSTPYCAAKAGLAMAVRSLAWELTSEGFYFNIVHPYHVPSTPMGARTLKNLMDGRGMGLAEAQDYQTKDLRLEEHLAPTDVARVVVWLLTEPVAPWLAGQGLQLYGGVR